MFNLGTMELVIILVVILLLFGNRLPELGAGLGKGIRNFKKASKEPDAIDITPEKKAENTQSTASKPDDKAGS